MGDDDMTNAELARWLRDLRESMRELSGRVRRIEVWGAAVFGAAVAAGSALGQVAVRVIGV